MCRTRRHGKARRTNNATAKARCGPCSNNKTEDDRSRGTGGTLRREPRHRTEATRIREKVETFDAFTPDNGPYKERGFGAFEQMRQRKHAPSLPFLANRFRITSGLAVNQDSRFLGSWLHFIKIGFCPWAEK
jgi:hypothetical protein